MRVQIMASLALLQLQYCVAAASGPSSNKMIVPSSNQGVASTPSGHNGHNNHGKPDGGSGASMDGSESGASLNQGSRKVKGLPRMESFTGIHLSPAEGGVVTQQGSATWDKRTVSSGTSSPDADWLSTFDCGSIKDNGLALPKRCYDYENIPDPIPSDCRDCIIARSVTDGGSATTETRALPTGSDSSHKINFLCPEIARRGGFVVRRCLEGTIGIPIWDETEMDTEPSTATVKKNRGLATSKVWTRSDGGESYLECGTIDLLGKFVAKRCPDDMLDRGSTYWDDLTPVATASPTKKRATGTTERRLVSSGVPSYIDECGIMGRRGDLLVRFVCCDTQCSDTEQLEYLGDSIIPVVP